jgi:hypothetical protein
MMDPSKTYEIELTFHFEVGLNLSIESLVQYIQSRPAR